MSKNTLTEVYLKFVQEDVESLYQKGRFHFDNKNFELANFYFGQILKKQPQHFWAAVDLAQVAVEQKLFIKAVTNYRHALTLAKSPNQICSVNYGLASVFVAMGLFDLAEHHYLQNLAEYPEHVYFYTGLAELYKSYRPDAIERIIELYQQALALAPHLTWIETELKIHQGQAAQKPGLDVEKKTTKPSVFQLYLQGLWVELFSQEITAQSVLNGYTGKEIIKSLKTLPPDAFSDLNGFYLYIADYLIKDFVIDQPFDDFDRLNAASIFLLRAINSSVIPDAALYIKTLTVLSFLNRFAEAEPIALQALLNYGDQAELLLATAKLAHEKCKKIDATLKSVDLKITQLLGDPSKVAATLSANEVKIAQLRTEKTQLTAEKVSALGASRLLFGEAASIAPEKLSEQDWSGLMSIHDQANRHKAKKFTNLNKFLLESAVAKQALALNTDTAALAPVDAWLHELSTLLGHFSVETFFDLAYYGKQTGLWFATVDMALCHYFIKGRHHNFSIHPSFDSGYVRQQLQSKGKASSAPELLLFLRYERELALAANVLFNAQRLIAQTPDEIGSPWLHYLAGGRQSLANPSDFFDTELYLTTGTYSKSETTESALVHFLKDDSTKNCNRLFHTQFYLKHYQASLNGKPPIVHYLTEGAYRGYRPNPFCDLSNKSGSDRIDYLKLLSL